MLPIKTRAGNSPPFYFVIITFCCASSHPTCAPSASATNLIGNNVLSLRTIGTLSSITSLPLTYMFLLPICNTIVVDVTGVGGVGGSVGGGSVGTLNLVPSAQLPLTCSC